MTLVGCRPIDSPSEESSSVESSSEVSSEVISSSSSSSSSEQSSSDPASSEQSSSEESSSHEESSSSSSEQSSSEESSSEHSSSEESSSEQSSSEESSSEQSSDESSSSESSQHSHVYDPNIWSKDKNHHWHECIECHEILDFAEHTWDTVRVEPTYDSEGSITKTCKVCGEVAVEVIPALEHHYSNEWSHNETNHWHACTDAGFEHLKKDESAHNYVKGDVIEPTETENGYTIYTCDVCGHQKYDDYTDPTGTHHYSSEWSHDEINHWHACTDADCDAKSELKEHDFEKVTVPATYDAPGKITYTCKVCSYSYEESIDQLVHNYSNEWSHNETNHWHACTDAGYENLKKDDVSHNYGTPKFTPLETPDYMNYKKGTYTYTCSVCGYSYDEEAKYSKQEMCDLMNQYISDKSYFDVFEMRDDLAKKYPVTDSLSASRYFGYDTALKKIVIFEDGVVIYPETKNSADFVSFRVLEVSTLVDLKNAVNAISGGSKSYSIIKLGADIETDTSIVLNSRYPMELNLNNHTINYTAENNGAIRVDKIFYQRPTLAITNGTIQTKDIDGFDYLSKSPSCVALYEAVSLRLTGLTLNNRAERGYSFIDSFDSWGVAELKISDCVFNSKIVALCLQANNNFVSNNQINGAVIINGGKTSFNNNVVDVTTIQEGLEKEATAFVSNSELYSTCKDIYVTKGYDTFMVNATDAVVIYDRRSSHSTYSSPEVNIIDNVLKCKYKNNTVYGYGIRYMDLNLDPNAEDNSETLGLLRGFDNNTYSYCISDNAYLAEGGYCYYHHV